MNCAVNLKIVLRPNLSKIWIWSVNLRFKFKTKMNFWAGTMKKAWKKLGNRSLRRKSPKTIISLTISHFHFLTTHSLRKCVVKKWKCCLCFCFRFFVFYFFWMINFFWVMLKFLFGLVFAMPSVKILNWNFLGSFF